MQIEWTAIHLKLLPGSHSLLPAARSLEQQASNSKGQSIRAQDCQDQDALPVIKLKTITVLTSVVPWHACHSARLLD